MRIKKVQLKNGYKRFLDLTIDLGDAPKRIVALVGPNGCGKSSVLDALLFESNSAYIPHIGGNAVKDYKYHSLHGDTQYNADNIIIEFEEGNIQDVRAERKKFGKERTLLSFRSSYRYNSHLNVILIHSTDDIKLNNYGASSCSDLDDKVDQNYRKLYIKYYNYLNTQDCKPSEAKAKIIGDLNASLSRCLDLEISSIGNIESQQGCLYFKKVDQPREFEFNFLSSGEKEVVDILLDLYLRKEEYDDTIFLIDEPELHINTAIQRNLLLEINRLIGENCQIWIATHSIGFLRALQDTLKDDCQIIQFPKGINWASSHQILSPIKKTHNKWKEIFETALDDLTGLISPKRIIYCEGRDVPSVGRTEQGLDAKIYNTIFSEKYHDTLFISSGGNTELDQRSSVAIAILGKVFSDIEIWVLKDRDMASGRPTNESDRQLYLKTTGVRLNCFFNLNPFI